MKTLNELGVFAVQHPRLAKTKKPYDAFAELFYSLTEDQREQHACILAALYLKFKPPVTSSVKKMSDLEILSKFAAVKDVRYYLNYVHVNADGYATASNGHYLVTTRQPTTLEPGFYDPKALVNVGDLDGARYPDFSRVLQPIQQPETVKLSDVKETREYLYGGKPATAWRLTEADIWFNSDYVKKFQKFFGVDHQCEIGTLDRFQQLRLDTEQFYTVLMATRV